MGLAACTVFIVHLGLLIVRGVGSLFLIQESREGGCLSCPFVLGNQNHLLYCS